MAVKSWWQHSIQLYFNFGQLNSWAFTGLIDFHQVIGLVFQNAAEYIYFGKGASPIQWDIKIGKKSSFKVPRYSYAAAFWDSDKWNPRNRWSIGYISDIYHWYISGWYLLSTLI